MDHGRWTMDQRRRTKDEERAADDRSSFVKDKESRNEELCSKLLDKNAIIVPEF